VDYGDGDHYPVVWGYIWLQGQESMYVDMG